MQRKVLMAAVNDYQGFAPDLSAPVKEVSKWQSLLSRPPYNMTILPPLINGGATRLKVLAGLKSLLTDARANDQLFFACFAHGSLVKKVKRGAKKALEEAIIFFPDGDPNLQNAALRKSDIASVLEETRPPKEANFVFLIESCFASAFVDRDSIPLFIPPPESIDLRSFDGQVDRFEDLAIQGVAEDVAMPIIVAACGERESAYEISEAGERRLLFSLRAVDRLRRNWDTYDDFIENIKPLRPKYPQTPRVIGSAERTSRRFLGEGLPSSEGAAAETSATGSASATASFSRSIRMRVLGMACFIEPNESSTFAARIVLPYDNIGSGSTWHFAFIEVADEDSTWTGVEPQKQYYRGGVNYSRWNLSGHRLDLANPDTSYPFARTSSFQGNVPHMTEITPELANDPPYPYPYPSDRCYDTYPDAQLFGAFFDLDSGNADTGELGDEIIFTRQYGEDPTYGPVTAPLSVIIDLPFTGENAILLISSSDGRNTQIFLKDRASIVVGVAREEDITGHGSGEVPREHFLIYYNLVDPKPLNPGLPSKQEVPINACTVTGYP